MHAKRRKRMLKMENKDVKREIKEEMEEEIVCNLLSVSSRFYLWDYFLSDLYSRRWRKNNFLKKSPDDTKKEKIEKEIGKGKERKQLENTREVKVKIEKDWNL